MLSPEIPEFCERWINKAENALSQDNLEGAFDGFFSYFVVFNRLYGTATLDLAKKGKVTLDPRRFPDSKAAKSYVLDYIGAAKLIVAIEQDNSCLEALNQIRGLLDQHRFHVKLDPHGNPQPKDDERLLQSLNSKGAKQRAEAILEVLYSIRCNMFHGQKGFNEVQREILAPSTTLLRKVASTLLSELKRSHH